MDPIIQFLSKNVLPEDKSTRFWLSEDQKLYKRSFSGPYLLCIRPEASELFLEELHEGICGSHTGGKFVICTPHPVLGHVNLLSDLLGDDKYN